MYILGINAAFHDTAAALVKDGKIIAAAEEERFTHIKHGKRPVPFSTWELPFHAIDYCLKTAGITIKDVDRIAYSFDPDGVSEASVYEDDLLSSSDLLIQPDVYNGWDTLFLNYIRKAPEQLRDGYPHHLQKRLANAGSLTEKWEFVNHHVAHAASAFFPSPFTEAAVMTLDGRGEKATTGYFMGKGNSLEQLSTVDMPHSLGMLYEKITTYLGFLHSSDEYKVMALASYGKPVYLEDFHSVIHVQDNGQYTIDEFDPQQWWGPGRTKEDPFEQLHHDIAHSLQKALEETVLKLANWLYTGTKSENLCMAGGVALNCVMNAVIRDKGPFKNIWVQPAAGDAGTALGAAQWLDVQLNSQHNDRYTAPMDHVYWGPDYTDDEIEKFMIWAKMPYKRLYDVAKETAAILAEDKIIAWYQGRMEFGPRSLGSRSILASPIHPDMQARLNDIKDREDFRPVAPVVLEEDAPEWFENADVSPFMLFVYPVKDDKADQIPAVRHTDGTARVQTINAQQHPLYYELISEFKKLTGVPVLVNTSFNTRGEPIVCSPRDAIECFWTSPFDALIINSFILEK
ncbi:carbamoyltransferase family protein [Dyadobacter fanqingshengii]|uniref:Carbamoyltransferase n=1 Tax=Dyadobacter fanqingshengii TaxID=2906443 RepID=A0A9X1P9R6_9BACT|nr:carbamoyltransferase C-terminal domain-containing protein [Dyadobacter fanqingshengii]MCF0041259.1 carbamoyltransferase [Dyadobacter fanqingshengii]USJ37016.1 carbamoyltransferase [Dyadobacter fanqingshengii]